MKILFFLAVSFLVLFSFNSHAVIKDGKVVVTYGILKDRQLLNKQKEIGCLSIVNDGSTFRYYELCSDDDKLETLSFHNKIPLLTDGEDSVVFKKLKQTFIDSDDGFRKDYYQFKVYKDKFDVVDKILSGRYSVIM